MSRSSIDCFKVPNLNLPPRLLLSTCDCKRISSMFSSFDSEKVSIVRSIGFHGLLSLPMLDTLNDELSLWLLKRLDFRNMILKLDSGAQLHLRNVDVHLMFGIPFEGQSVQYVLKQSNHALNAVLNKMWVDSNHPNLTLPYLQYVLEKDYELRCNEHQKVAFKIAIVLYCVSYFLAPGTNHAFPLPIICNFSNAVKPEEINWAEYVLWTLGRAAMHVQSQIDVGSNKIVLFGCSLLLQIFYLDNLNCGPISPYHIVLPRAKVFPSHVISELIASDLIGISDDNLLQFGRTKVKEGFDVCYTRGWHDNINIHISLSSTYQSHSMDSKEMLSSALELFDHFQGNANRYNIMHTSSHQELINAMLYLKSCVIKLYGHHMPDSNSSKQRGLATSNYPSSSRLSLQHQQDIISVSSILSGRANEQQASSSRIQPALLTQRKLVTSHSNFSIPWMDLVVHHEVVSRRTRLNCFVWLTDPKRSWDELNCDWISFSNPIQISIPGHLVQHCLKLNGHFSVSIVDAIMIVWNYLDAKVQTYFEWHQQTYKRWRHFLPASFAEIVLDGYDYLNSHVVRSSFIGDGIAYNIADCQLIIVPVLLEDSWSCYFWDFKTKKVTILDPMLMTYSALISLKKHHHIVSKLHEALFTCKEHFFSGWDVDSVGWVALYRTDVDRSCKQPNSGLNAVHYARSFSGDKIAFRATDPLAWNLSEARGLIAYEIFNCAQNKGYKPMFLMGSTDEF